LIVARRITDGNSDDPAGCQGPHPPVTRLRAAIRHRYRA
jgi:hypothetical protein